jgi:PucR C-terminal helix-turn-helix domain/GGDEF-like domain
MPMRSEEKRIRGELAARVGARSPEIERAFLTRIGAIAEVETNAELLAGLRAAARESIAYALGAIEEGESWAVVVPPTVAGQIRLLAREGVSLEATLNGYSTVHNLLVEFITEEMDPLPRDVLGQMLRVQSQQSDKLMMAFTDEYASEVARLERSSSQRLAERVQGLLAGEPMQGAELGYDLDAWHLGAIAAGKASELSLRRLAEELGCQLLSVPRGPVKTWAWLGAQRSISVSEFERLAASTLGASVSLAIGEPRQGLEGWRLTHQEAQIALTIMLRSPERLVRCADVVLLAAAARDDKIAGFLLDAYLRPLERRKDGEALKRTLRSYLNLGGNAASAAAALGVDRHTVQRHLGKIEESLGRPLDSCRAELEVALRVDALNA